MAVPAFVWSGLMLLLKFLAPNVRTLFEEAMKGVYKSAMESPNKIDDIGVKILMTATGVDVSGVVVTPSPASENLPPDVVDTVAGSLLQVVTGRPFEDGILNPIDTM